MSISGLNLFYWGNSPLLSIFTGEIPQYYYYIIIITGIFSK